VTRREEILAALDPVEVALSGTHYVADALLPLVDRLCAEAAAEATSKTIADVQAIYDMQCPVAPIEHYMDNGAYWAHLWWQRVLGGALDRLRYQAAALTETKETDRG
jgi:hypothetical protein